MDDEVTDALLHAGPSPLDHVTIALRGIVLPRVHRVMVDRGLCMQNGDLTKQGIRAREVLKSSACTATSKPQG